MPVSVLTEDGEESYEKAEKWHVDQFGQLHLTKPRAQAEHLQIATYARGTWVAAVATGDSEPSVGEISSDFAEDMFKKHPAQCIAALEAEVTAQGLDLAGDVRVGTFWRNGGWRVRLTVPVVQA